jgi:YidC/Oxa1 family membrane protein insertase
MEKRVLLATLLSLGFLFLWQYLTYKPPQKQSEQVQQKKEIIPMESKEITETKFDPFVIETEKLKVVFNKYNAGIREFYIKEENSTDYTLLSKSDNDSLAVDSQSKFEVKKIYESKFTKIIFTTKEKQVEYIFSSENPYFIDVSYSFLTKQKVNLLFQHYVHLDKFETLPNVVHICKTLKTDKKEISLVEKFNKGSLSIEEIRWVAVGDKYSLIAFLFDPTISQYISIDKLNKNTKSVFITTKDEVNNYKLRILVTLKKISILTSLGNKFTHTVEWGTFAILSKLFYNILVYFYKLFGNYGLAIIGLTIITQLITFPLTYSSIKSAIKMRKLQPQIQLIQKLYKDDPKRLNMEIMNFYKEKKVNPFGGCLPLLLQIPIFWALFTMLRNTYDLRGASFVLWIKDLSQPDKIFIPGTNIGIPVLVFLMGATMLLQQYISGSFSEPQQKTFAIFMPILFTILFLNFPSGLVLYWFVNNIFSIVIQIVANKTVKV